MSTVSTREKSMLLIMVVLVLYALAALSYKKQMTNWNRAKRVYEGARQKSSSERDLIAATAEWDTRYTRMRDLMPVFPYEQDVATYWLNIMEDSSLRNDLVMTRRQVGKEAEVGDVYELPIECRDWEGTLESLVKFLHDLQKAGAMLDVRQLFIRPANRPGYLKGTFTLTCAYMRSNEATVKRASVFAGTNLLAVGLSDTNGVPETMAQDFTDEETVEDTEQEAHGTSVTPEVTEAEDQE